MFYNKHIWSCKANILQRKTYLILQTNICDTIKQTYVMFYNKYMWWIKEAYVMWCYKTNICDVLQQTYMTCSKTNTWCYAAKQTRVVQQKRQARHILIRREIKASFFWQASSIYIIPSHLESTPLYLVNTSIYLLPYPS